jgi:hypothetical protein
LRVPAKQRKRRRLAGGTSENASSRKRAEYKDHVWSYDFVVDRTEDGRTLKMMPVVDEYSRECLTLEVERSITAEEVVRTMMALFNRRGEPAFIRSDRTDRGVHRRSGKAVAYGLRGRDAVHRARLSLGKCLLRDVHRPLQR